MSLVTAAAPKAVVAAQKTVAIIGGGISGLSAAHYLIKKFGDSVRPIILEKEGRTGGWIRSVRKPEADLVFETGPRSIRPLGINGMNTLDLIEEIGLDKSVWYVEKTHPVARNRFIYKGGKLCKLPTDMSPIFKTKEPFTKPLIGSILKDIFSFRKKLYDDTIFNFIERRFGTEVAEYLIDPLIRGICAGNARDISIKMNFKEVFELEQKYGSVVLGWALKNIRHAKDDILTDFEKEIGFSKIASSSLVDNWSVYTLENGLESLPEKLESNLIESDSGEILKDAQVQSVKFIGPNDVQIIYNGGHLNCHHVMTAIPSWSFSKLLDFSTLKNLCTLLSQNYAASCVVVNVIYNEEDVIREDGFGFLVPSKEASTEIPGLLGVVFDSCAFPQGKRTVLTLMCQLDETLLKMNEIDKQSEILRRTRACLKHTLNIHRAPDDYYISQSKECIPQYTIGHFERIEAARKIIDVSKLPLSLIGASYDGVSVNDCILSAKRAVHSLPEEL